MPDNPSPRMREIRHALVRGWTNTERWLMDLRDVQCANQWQRDHVDVLIRRCREIRGIAQDKWVSERAAANSELARLQLVGSVEAFGINWEWEDVPEHPDDQQSVTNVLLAPTVAIEVKGIKEIQRNLNDVMERTREAEKDGT